MHYVRLFLAALYLLDMATKRIEERKTRDRQARRTQIIRAARKIAQLEGWSSVTVRRLSDEISYSQPVLYSHFANRESIVAAVAIEGFQELGLALQKARQSGKHRNSFETVAKAYLDFAVDSPALYESMFSLSLNVPFGDPATPPELRFAFSQLLELFSGRGTKPEIMSELFWATLHGIAEFTRSERLPPKQQNERLRMLIKMFSVAADADNSLRNV